MSYAQVVLLITLLVLIILISVVLTYKEKFLDHMIVPKLKDGLGNQLFELGTAYGLSKTLNKTLQLHSDYIHKSGHSVIDYMDSIFVNFKQYITTDKPSMQISPRITASDYITLRDDPTPAELVMYNQDWKKMHPYRAEFVDLLVFNTEIASKYPKLDASAFIHFRGGDFIGLQYLNVPLKNYYIAAVELLKSHGVNHIYVFTNDKPYAQSFNVLESLQHTYVDENEYDSLYLMSRCAYGGICANSTYSWWGLYLNIDRPYLIMPNTWIVDAHRPEGFYPDFHFPEATVIDNT